MFLHCTYI